MKNEIIDILFNVLNEKPYKSGLENDETEKVFSNAYNNYDKFIDEHIENKKQAYNRTMSAYDDLGEIVYTYSRTAFEIGFKTAMKLFTK